MSPRILLSALLAAVLLAGCGGDSGTKTITQVETVKPQTTSTPTQAQTTPTIPRITTPETTSTQPAPPQQGSSGSRSQAIARVRREGYRPDDTGDYDSSATLRVLVGTRTDSGDGYAKRAFFFVGDRYIGTDTSDDSANIRVEGQTDDTVTLAYAIYGPNDALCCPGRTETVRYRWNGSRLEPLDSIPPRSSRG
jgi:LppP/LprE lipoprotein